jgi:hypothetical protein
MSALVAALLALPSVACSHRDREAAPRAGDLEARSPASSAIDVAITEHWAAHGVTPVGFADDVTLLRRASLDLLGRIPTVAELDAFVADTGTDRYERAVDRMLASPDHAKHLAVVWADVLLDGSVEPRPKVELGTQRYLEQQFADDVAFDRIASELIGFTGPIEADSAAGFLIAHGRQRRTTTVAAATARVFLAAQIQCAQCHDHPSAPFTQEQFYAFAAHYARATIRPKADAPKIVERLRGEQRLPRPEDAPDEPGGAIVAPAYFGTPTVSRGSRRDALASLVVEDRRFARALANRAWAQMFGRGIVEPVDDLPLVGEVPPLLEAVADRVVADGYQIDAVLRELVLSTAYRRDTRADDVVPARTAAFAQASIRPLPLSSLVQSLTVAGIDHDAPVVKMLDARRGDLRDLRFAFADDEGASVDEGPSLQQSLLLLQGKLTDAIANDGRGRALAAILREHADMDARIDALWWRFYSRKPDDAERRLAHEHLADAQGNDAYEDLVHAMITSTEFITNH